MNGEVTDYEQNLPELKRLENVAGETISPSANLTDCLCLLSWTMAISTMRRREF